MLRGLENCVKQYVECSHLVYLQKGNNFASIYMFIFKDFPALSGQTNSSMLTGDTICKISKEREAEFFSHRLIYIAYSFDSTGNLIFK
jgi:hypothetical protein